MKGPDGMSKLAVPHTDAFLKIRASANPKESLRELIHKQPLFVFWVSSSNKIIDAYTAHNDYPPNGDRSVLADTIYHGFLRGRAAYIDDVVYVVIYYWPRDGVATQRWKKRVNSAYGNILLALSSKRKIDKGVCFVEEGSGDMAYFK